MSARRLTVFILGTITLLSLVFLTANLSGLDIPVLKPSGEIASRQSRLIIFTVFLAAVVVMPVFVMLGLFAWRYRSGNKKPKRDSEWSSDKKLEIIWWGIPSLIIIVLCVVTYMTSHSLDPYKKIESNEQTLNVQVVALQWKWLFIYPDQKVATVNELTIPEETPVSFRITADAPMSSFWIPALGSQVYSMNGMTTQLNLIASDTGEFDGYNTNINGEGYSKMKFKVKSVSSQDFREWTSLHSGSMHTLDRVHFDELASPGTISAPMYMSLKEPDIFDYALSKYHEVKSDTNSSVDQKEGHH